VRLKLEDAPCPCGAEIKDSLLDGERSSQHDRGDPAKLSLLTRYFPHDEETFSALRFLFNSDVPSDQRVEFIVAEGLRLMARGGPTKSLSVEKTEELQAIRKHRFTNVSNADRLDLLLVRFCNQPWLVDREFSSAGLCYYGNFGDMPRFGVGLRLLVSNKSANAKYT
jgi:hypothetical protein